MEKLEDLTIPKHLGIILDGNRRYAKKTALNPLHGHKLGADTLRNFLDWIKEFKIKEVTIYTLSMQNIQRPKVEVDFLYALMKQRFSYYLTEEGFKELQDDQVKIKVIGRTNLLPQALQDIFNELMQRTKDFNKYILNFAIPYGGREEIVDATKKLCRDVASNKLQIQDINKEVFAKYLYLNSDPELIIRTSGHIRTSNFLPWQSAYSEWIFIDKLWPEFTKEDFINCLKDFSKRKRNFGK